MESVYMWAGIGCFNMNSNWFRIASASSNKSAKAITSPDKTDCATRRDLYDLYQTGMEYWLSSVWRNIRLGCDDESTLLASAASLYAVICNEL